MPSMDSFCSDTGPGGVSLSNSMVACRTALRLASLRTAMPEMLSGPSRIATTRALASWWWFALALVMDTTVLYGTYRIESEGVVEPEPTETVGLELELDSRLEPGRNSTESKPAYPIGRRGGRVLAPEGKPYPFATQAVN